MWRKVVPRLWASSRPRLAAAAALSATSIATATAAPACDGQSANQQDTLHRQWHQPQVSPGHIQDHYTLGSELGSGAFAVVRQGFCKRTGKAVAIKAIPKSKQDAASLKHEVAVLQRVSMHKHIAKLEAFYETPSYFYIVMEFVSGGELFDHLVEHGAYSEREAASLLQDVCGALALLHAQGLCHADIKPENMLLTEDDHVKLVDFGLSCDIHHTGTSSRSLGTLAYWPPEILDGSGGPGLPMDMWALGCVLYILLEGVHPFDTSGRLNEDELKKNICSGEPSFEDWNASIEAKSLVLSLLKKNPAERLTIEELLQHPWLLNIPTPVGASGGAEMKRREKLRVFRERSAKLRAACFAVLLQQVAQEESKYFHQDGHKSMYRKVGHDASFRDSMIEHDVLAKAFQVFDVDGKGYISEADLSRVLASFGRHNADTHEWLEAAAENDREGVRVAYGSYVRLMSNTVKQSLKKGSVIFDEGAPVKYFYCLLSGEVEVTRNDANGNVVVVNTLNAGEYFGENSLLAGSSTHSAGVRCSSDVEILKLSREDFEAGITGAGSTSDDGALRMRLLSFIQMVTPSKKRLYLRQGDAIFREGDATDNFYILSKGKCAVAGEEGSPAHQDGHPLGVIHEGEGFGEGSLMTGAPKRSKTVTCASAECQITSVRARDFMRLVEKSSVVRQSFERLHNFREEYNQMAQAQRRKIS